MTNKQQTAYDLLSEKNLWPQTLLEDYLSVALNLRKCSLMTVPAEFPDAEAIAKAIDLACVSDYHRVALETDIKEKGKLIRKFKHRLREAYRENIRGSSSYRNHIAWTSRLRIQVFEVEVRPTVREFFLYTEKQVKRTLEELSASRTLFRERFLRSLRESLPPSAVAYPEEYFPDYVLRIGELLGYPKCCTEAYLEGRKGGRVLAEERASKQIRTGRAQGIEPEPYAYFVKDFIPCTPTCTNATAIGRKLSEGFGQFDNRLCAFYIQCLKTNVANVESYMERIAAHKEKMRAQAQELGIESSK